jgi:hypothetical protein
MFPVKLFMDDYFDPNIQKTPLPETGFQKFPVSNVLNSHHLASSFHCHRIPPPSVMAGNSLPVAENPESEPLVKPDGSRVLRKNTRIQRPDSILFRFGDELFH